MAATPDVLTGTFAGRYTIERELGRGATATVYLARDLERGRSVAIKLMKAELAQSIGAERFLREIKLTEKLHHPHIVPVLDSGDNNGQLYCVLPHMEEGSLRQLLMREKQLPIETAITIVRTVAEALEYAHQQKLIHRDVKPENILFTSGQACLADFGIARAVERAIDESTTETGLVRGTPAYMSPEQASGSKHYDGRSDQYSLACVLYEMLAGVPAFIGPTPEAVIAQRFQHQPRELRVFRPSVPQGIEDVILKALSVTAADRFATVAEFASALETADRTPSSGARAREDRGLSRLMRIAYVGAALAVVGVGVLTATVGLPNIPATDARADSLKYVVLPMEGDRDAPLTPAYDLLLQAMAKWDGVTVVDAFAIRDALGRDSVADDRRASRLAKRLGAGRYVRVRVSKTGGSYQVVAAAFDASSHKRSAVSTASVGLDLNGAVSAFDGLARSLLLPNADSTLFGSRNVPALTFFAAGMKAVDEFNLTAADSLLSASLEHDPKFARAGVWLAQVRNWQLEPVRRWLVWAEGAAASKDLTPREGRLAAALVAMGKSEYQAACALYDSLRVANARDFAAWYGLGQCRHRDNIVVRDPRSPSGWRYRSSYHQAVQAYLRALELAPELHRGFEPGAYSRLRFVLYTMRSNVRGGVTQAAPGTRPMRFNAYATWSHDSLLFIPYPDSVFQSQTFRVSGAERTLAVTRQREVFAQIARTWSTALPRSAGAKEAVAIAMEMLGDPAAIDTIEAARRLATEPVHHLRLAQQSVLLQMEFGRRDPVKLRAAQRLGDSLLAAHGGDVGQREAEILAPIATLLGRCRAAVQLSARSANPNRASDLDIAPFALAIADSITIHSSLGCRPNNDRAAIQRFRDGLQGPSGARPAPQRQALEYMLLARSLSLGQPPDSARVAEMASFSGDPILRAQHALLTGDTISVRSTLEGREAWRRDSDSPISPDGALEEARLALAIADTTAAIRLMEPLLARTGWLEFLDEPSSVASLLHVAALRASLGRDDVARTWAGFVLALWSTADHDLDNVTSRLKSLPPK